MKEYKYTGENCLSELSLHDCVVSRLCARGLDLVLDMEFMEVCRGPLNPYPQAHSTGRGKIVFMDVESLRCLADGQEFALPGAGLGEMTVLDYDERDGGGKFHAEMYMAFNSGADFYGLTLEFSFGRSRVMWDEYAEVSWFERWLLGGDFVGRVEPLLDCAGKSFAESVRDLYAAMNLVYWRRELGEGRSEEAYRLALGDLYGLELSDEEERFVIHAFETLVIDGSPLDLFCIGCLGKYPTKDEVEFLFSRLVATDASDEVRLVALIREVAFWRPDGLADFLARLSRSPGLSEEFAGYLAAELRFVRGEVSSMSEPSVDYDSDGGGRRVRWRAG